MAGIGFELKKIAVRGGILSISQVIFSGAIIVAGPWMISIINILFAQQFLNDFLAGSSEYLIETLVYSYALSLVIFGGFHYPFTRMLSDMIYENREKDALIQAILIGLVLGIVSFLFAFFLLSSLEIPSENPGIYRFAGALFFGGVNVLWIMMLFVSVLKWFYKICLSYAAGAAVTQILLKLNPTDLGIEWVILAFALGQLFIVILLLIFSIHEYPGGEEKTLKPLFEYLKKYKIMFFIGFSYNLGLWIDKIIFWIFRGASEGGTALPLYPAYDTSVYIANLAVIPGLIYFVIISETNFYILLKKFMFSLKNSTYRDITIKKYKLLNRAKKDLAEQSFLQGILGIILIIIAPAVTTYLIPGTSNIIYILSISSSFLFLIFLTNLNFHFYLEAYRQALFGCIIFSGLNFITGIITVLVPEIPPGAGYCLACGASAFYSYYSLKNRIRYMDRKIFIGAGSA